MGVTVEKGTKAFVRVVPAEYYEIELSDMDQDVGTFLANKVLQSTEFTTQYSNCGKFITMIHVVEYLD